MEKIIILSGCEGPDEELVAYLGALFPGCSIEILRKDAAVSAGSGDSIAEIDANGTCGIPAKIVDTRYH
jgi:hypothetical protein